MVIARYSVFAVLALCSCADSPARRAAPGAEPYLATQQVATARLAVVFSAGSLRGFAHIGVLQQLEANGIRPDLVVGTSAGAIVGGLFASGMNAAALHAAARAVNFDPFSGMVLARLGVRRALVHEFVAQHTHGARIEAFPIRFAAVATDLQDGCLAVFNAGDAASAVQASAAMPGVFAPSPIGDRNYADGGIVSPLPVRVARALGAAIVIAVDVTYDPRESQLTSTIDRLFQTALVMIKSQARREARQADLVIEPTLPPEAEVTLENRDALIAAGARAAAAALPQIKTLLAVGAPRPSRVGAAMSDSTDWCKGPTRGTPLRSSHWLGSNPRVPRLLVDQRIPRAQHGPARQGILPVWPERATAATVPIDSRRAS